ncbi:MAG: hypothetical protein K2Q18_06120 [Bdellovibrionales bacterium]|nr:hypothetical protein [Bdellovibrionales bacterium]
MEHKIDISKIPIEDFSKTWSAHFEKENSEMFKFYSMMRCFTANQEYDLNSLRQAWGVYLFIVNTLCWENIILPIYWLNGKKLTGNYKVLTNNKKDGFHVAIYDEANSTILDPTYEKASDVQLIPGNKSKGTACTKLMLGNECYYFDLEYYLSEFKMKDQSWLAEDLGEKNDRIKKYMESIR